MNDTRPTGRLIPGADSGTIRAEQLYPTDPADLWSAITDPLRLARWIAHVEGDLRPGGAFTIRFTSGWEGTGRVEVCEPPRRLVVANREDDGTETVIEALVVAEGDGTRLIVEDRGLPLEEYHFHGAGWQAHLEDLAAALAGRDASDWRTRWRELIPAYEELRDRA